MNSKERERGKKSREKSSNNDYIIRICMCLAILCSDARHSVCFVFDVRECGQLQIECKAHFIGKLTTKTAQQIVCWS